MSEASLKPLMKPSAAAALIQCGERWLTDQARAGTVPARRIGRHWRFSEEDVQAIIAGAARGGVASNPWGLSKRAGGRRRRAS